MTLDDDLAAHSELRHRSDRDAFLDEREADWRDRELCESEAATEAHWAGVFARQTVECPETIWPDDRRGVDRRLFDRDAAVADGLIADDEPVRVEP